MAVNRYALKPKEFGVYSKAKKNEHQADDKYLHWRDAEVYKGDELKSYEGRPGAMDAYSLPSRGLQ